MRQLSKIVIAVLCAMSIPAVVAQTIQRDGKEVKPAQSRAPIQAAQAPAGGAASGGAAGGATAATGTMSLGTMAVIGFGVMAVVAAASSGDDNASVTHQP